MRRKHLVDLAIRRASPSATRSVATEQDIATVDEERPRREYVDLSSVPPQQQDMHERLEDWARWCRSRTGQNVAPGFGMNKSDGWDQREYGAPTVVPVNKDDCARVATGVAKLPEPNRLALQWFYLKKGRKAHGQCSAQGLTMDGLRDAVVNGRTMLINKGV